MAAKKKAHLELVVNDVDLTQLSDEEIDTEWIAADEIVQQARDEKRRYQLEVDRRHDTDQIDKVLGKLSASGRAQLAQRLGLTGIPSEEAAGTPGE